MANVGALGFLNFLRVITDLPEITPGALQPPGVVPKLCVSPSGGPVVRFGVDQVPGFVSKLRVEKLDFVSVILGLIFLIRLAWDYLPVFPSVCFQK